MVIGIRVVPVQFPRVTDNGRHLSIRECTARDAPEKEHDQDLGSLWANLNQPNAPNSPSCCPTAEPGKTPGQTVKTPKHDALSICSHPLARQPWSIQLPGTCADENRLLHALEYLPVGCRQSTDSMAAAGANSSLLAWVAQAPVSGTPKVCGMSDELVSQLRAVVDSLGDAKPAVRLEAVRILASVSSSLSMPAIRQLKLVPALKARLVDQPAIAHAATVVLINASADHEILKTDMIQHNVVTAIMECLSVRNYCDLLCADGANLIETRCHGVCMCTDAGQGQ
jgi:hypothetical protein